MVWHPAKPPANRTLHTYIYKSPDFLPPERSYKSDDHAAKIAFLTRIRHLDLFFTMRLCGHLSYSAHHPHSHSTFLKLLAPLLLATICAQPTSPWSLKSLPQNLPPPHLPSPASVCFLQKSHENPPTPFRPSPTHSPLSLPSSHQFSSIPPHYSQLPSSLNHTAHPTRNRFPHAFSMHQ
jgi:hypothetical protein